MALVMNLMFDNNSNRNVLYSWVVSEWSLIYPLLHRSASGLYMPESDPKTAHITLSKECIVPSKGYTDFISVFREVGRL